MKKNKIYIISGLILSASVITFIVLTKKEKVKPEDAAKAEEEINSREGIPTEQTNIPANLKAIVDLPLADAKKLLVGKNVYSKVSNVNVRSGPAANNGYLNNKIATIPTKGTLIGKIVDVKENVAQFYDTEVKKPNGMKFKWMKIQPFSSSALTQMNANDARSFSNMLGLTSKFNASTDGYVSEETITI